MDAVIILWIVGLLVTFITAKITNRGIPSNLHGVFIVLGALIVPFNIVLGPLFMYCLGNKDL